MMIKIYAVVTLFVSQMNPSWGRCTLSVEQLRIINNAAKEQRVDPSYMIKIAGIESGYNHKAIRINKNKTIDVGIFQINSINWESGCKGIDVFSFAGNVKCAAKLIKRIQKRYSKVDAMWIGRYHSSTEKLKIIYYNRMFGEIK